MSRVVDLSPSSQHHPRPSVPCLGGTQLQPKHTPTRIKSNSPDVAYCTSRRTFLLACSTLAIILPSHHRWSKTPGGWLDKSHLLLPSCQAANSGLHSARGVGTLQLHWSSSIRIKKPTASFGFPFLVLSFGCPTNQRQAADVIMTLPLVDAGGLERSAGWWARSYMYHLSHSQNQMPGWISFATCG